MAHYQRGMTMWGMAVVLALIAFFTLLGLKLFPPYLEYGKVRSIMRSSQVVQLASGSREALVDTLEKRFDIDLISSVDPHKDLFIEQRGRTRVVRLTYQVKVPLVYNITALLDFNEIVEVKGFE